MNFTNLSNFQLLEVVDRVSDTQLQEAENLNGIAQCSEVCIPKIKIPSFLGLTLFIQG